MNILAELLEMELNTEWIQLQLRLRAVTLSEQGDEANPEESTGIDPKRAKERYEELRASYQEKSLKLARAKRKIRLLMSTLHERSGADQEATVLADGRKRWGYGRGHGRYGRGHGRNGRGHGRNGRGHGRNGLGDGAARWPEGGSSSVRMTPAPNQPAAEAPPVGINAETGQDHRMPKPSFAAKVVNDPVRKIQVIVVPADPDERKKRLSEVDLQIEKLNQERNLLLGGSPN